jgi:DNA-binding NarL/FixJ family response regulator
MSGARKHRVLIVEDHPVVRDALAGLIELQTDLMVCAQAEDVRSAKDAVQTMHPDLIVLDLMIGHGDGLEFLRGVHAEHPQIRVVVFSMHDERDFAERALRAGASGYVSKSQPARDVLEAIRAVVKGEIYLSPKHATLLMRKALKLPATHDARDKLSGLTDRELHVFQLIGAGLSTREIAADLCLSVKTIESYRESIKTKAGFRNGAELVRAAKAWIRTAKWD